MTDHRTQQWLRFDTLFMQAYKQVAALAPHRTPARYSVLEAMSPADDIKHDMRNRVLDQIDHPF
jgi:hypothetical protein